MENKRKIKINKYYNQLVEEKNDLVELIERHANQLFCCIEKVNNDAVNQKDLHKFLEFELKLIQKFEEFNFELESLQDECPIKALNVRECDLECHDSTNVFNIRGIQTDVEPPNSVNNLSVGAETSTHETEVSLEISGADLQNLRDNLKTASEKLGLNDQNLSSIRNFYSKPLSTSVGGFSVNPSVSLSRYLPEEYYPNGDSYEIPEKDINPSQTVLLNIGLNQQGANNEEILTNVIKSEQIEDNTDSVSVDITSSTESSDSNLGNSSTHNNVDGFKTYNELCTAILKLNNLKVDKSKESIFDVKPLEQPDLTLKVIHPIASQPATVIRNFETKNKKTKKKNNSDTSLTFDLKPKAVPQVGDICAFSHIETPSDFYIHLVDDESTLIDKISENIAKISLNRRHYKSREEAYRNIQKYGVVYITAYSNWYRMEVLDWYHDHKHANVLVKLVDYGSTHLVSFENLGKLTKNLADIPKLAVHCHFPLMYPPNSTALNKLTQWPQDTISQFMEISGLVNQGELQENLFKLAYASWNPELNAVEIDLIHIDEVNEEYTIGQILLNLGLAVQIADEYEEDETELGEFLQDIDTLEAADNINEAVTGYDARDEARICRFTKPDGTCFKGKNCKLEHKLLPKDGYTTDKDVVFREAMYSLLLPKQGEFLMVLITGYKNICNVFVQIIRKPVKERSYMVDRDFQLLMEQINSPKELKSYQGFKVAPAIGEIVLVKHWSSQWLRGVVRDFDTNPNGEPFNFQVFAVDYGETLVNLKSSDVRKIKPHYLQLPFQAVESYIKDYECNIACASKKVKNFFDRNMYFHNFMATILSSSLPLGLILTSLNGTINIGESLNEKGFATKRAYDINPSGDCPLDLH